MGFNEDLLQLSERIINAKEKIMTEEATKMSMIVPFFQTLGYDVFNSNEFCPEYTADVGIKKGEKVDYAIIQNDEPIILIECKWCGDDLEKHSSQLFRYFSTTPAKFGILTNGLLYKFYTDLDESNKMDLTPFLEVNMADLKEAILNELKKFCKSNFDKEKIFSTASELKYSNMIKDVLKAELEEPSEDFTRFFLSKIYEGLKNQKTIDKFKPIVKKSFNSFINEIMNQKISSALNTENSKEEPPVEETPPIKVVTTQTEIEAFYIIRGILAEITSVNDIVYRDAESYFAILYKDNNRKPICRMFLDGKRKQIHIPNDDKTFSKYNIDSLNDIYQYKKELISATQRYIIE